MKKPLCDYRDTFYGSSLISPTPGVSYPIPPGPGAGGRSERERCEAPPPLIEGKARAVSEGGHPAAGAAAGGGPAAPGGPRGPSPARPPRHLRPPERRLGGGPGPAPLPAPPGDTHLDTQPLASSPTLFPSSAYSCRPSSRKL